MKNLMQITAAVVFGLAAFSPVLAEGLAPEEVEEIFAVLEEMQCEMDDADIQKEADGYDLDDVFCADGQQDIKMSLDFEVVSVRKE